MKPIIIACRCGKVRKFGEWITPTVTQAASINSGTYKKQFENCVMCKAKPGVTNMLLPVHAR